MMSYNVHLLNASVMPAEGFYFQETLSAEQFRIAVRSEHGAGRLQSYIGYENTLLVLAELTGIVFERSQEQTRMSDGDVFLVMKLRRRVSPDVKRDGDILSVSDFDFCRGVYYRRGDVSLDVIAALKRGAWPYE